jgi:hypothetical protein
VVGQDLNIDLTDWHIYRILWREDYLGVFVDNMDSPIATVTDPDSIPSTGLTFTIWVDNYIMTGDHTDYTRGYLDVPAMDQHIDVDYVKIYVPDPAPVPTISAGGLTIAALLLLAVGTGGLAAARTP